ncbi:MAG: succinylglutamate desuccinylase/aspartoacylase family protein [Phycisphaerales bacterium]|nr:succinylglutamate desuccinylase/aspartoacylase family protein [Planctomycetota bacterium]MCH8507691.1 succinylglutamate desuccinylase/aspartoacylase family protein [Phycisphaerales bacterium]
MRVLLAIACLWLLSGCAATRPAEIGRSIHQAPIVAEDHGRGRARVYLIGLIHGDEPEGYQALDDIRRLLRRHPGIRVRLVPDMNPDGRLAGTRGNARGVDLNRNWPASNFTPHPQRGESPLSEPEARAVHDDLLAFRPDVLIVLHSITRGGPFVNFDGPDPAADLARVFADAAGATGDPRWRVVPSMGYPTPGSLGTFAGTDMVIPTLTVEFERGHDPETARQAAVAGIDAVLARLTATRRRPPAPLPFLP